MRAEQVLRAACIDRLTTSGVSGDSWDRWGPAALTENMRWLRAGLHLYDYGATQPLLDELQRPATELSGYMHLKLLASALAHKALRTRGLQRSPVKDVLPPLLDWWRTWLAVAARCERPDGLVVIPGVRVEWSEGEYAARTTSVYRALLHLPPHPEAELAHNYGREDHQWFAGSQWWRTHGPVMEPALSGPSGAQGLRPAYDIVGWDGGVVSMMGDAIYAQDGPMPVVYHGGPQGPEKFRVSERKPEDARSRNWTAFAQGWCSVEQVGQSLVAEVNGRYVPASDKAAHLATNFLWRETFPVTHRLWSFTSAGFQVHDAAQPAAPSPGPSPPAGQGDTPGTEPGWNVEMSVWVGRDKAGSADEAWIWVRDNMLSEQGKVWVQREPVD